MRHGLRFVMAALLLLLSLAFTFAGGAPEGGGGTVPATEAKIIG